MNTGRISVSKRVRLLVLVCSTAALLLLALLWFTRVGVAQEILLPPGRTSAAIASLPSHLASLPVMAYHPVAPAPEETSYHPSVARAVAGRALEYASPAPPQSGASRPVNPGPMFAPGSEPDLHDPLAASGIGLVDFVRARPPAAEPGITPTKAITLSLTNRRVYGYVAADANVHVLLWNGGTLAGEARDRSDALGLFAADIMHEGRFADLQPGLTLDVAADGATRSMTVPRITGTTDPGADTVTGKVTGVPLPAALRVAYGDVAVAVNTDAAGNYTASFAGLLDLGWSMVPSVTYGGAGGSTTEVAAPPLNGMYMAPAWNAVYGYAMSGTPVTATLDHAGSIAMGTATAAVWSGQWRISFGAIQAGDRITAEIGADQVVATVANLSVQVDPKNDRALASGPPNSVLTVCNGSTCRTGATNAAGQYAAQFPAGSLIGRSWVTAIHHTTAQADTYGAGGPAVATAAWAYNFVYGNAEPGAAMTAALVSGSAPPQVLETVTGHADASGYYRLTFTTPFAAGQRMRVQGGGLDTTIDITELTLRLETDTERITGEAPPGAQLSLVYWTGWPYWSYQGNATAGANGRYALNLQGIMDIHNGGGGGQALLPQGNDFDAPGWQYRYGRAPLISVGDTWNGLNASFPEPNAPVTLTLRGGDGTVREMEHATTNETGYLSWLGFVDDAGNWQEIGPGDTVEVDGAGYKGSVTVPALTMVVDSAADRVTGTGPKESLVEVQVRWASPTLRVPTDSQGRFVADFTGLVDIGRRQEVAVWYYDTNWNQVFIIGRPAYADANIVLDTIGGYYGANVTAWFTVTAPAGEVKGNGTHTARSDGWMDWVDCGCDLQPGDIVDVSSGVGYRAHMVAIDITGKIDVEADRVSGRMMGGVFPARGGVNAESQARGQSYWTEMDIAADGTYNVDFAGRFDLRLGDQAYVAYFDPNGNEISTMLYTPHLDIELWYNPGAHSHIWGRAEPGAAVTVTTPYTCVTTQADAQGNWNLPDVGPLVAGDPITAQAPGLPPIAVPVPNPFDVQADSQTDKVWGQVGGWANQRLEIHGNWPAGYREVTTDGEGRFEATYSDIPRGGEGYIRFVNRLTEYAGVVYHRSFRASDLIMWINCAGDHVIGPYDLGHTAHFTITDGEGAIKATAVVSTVPNVGWGGAPGFSVSGETWSPPSPDITSGDWVYGTMENGHSAMAHIGVITGTVDVRGDSVTGRVYAPWFTQTLNIDCHPWGAPPGTPSKQSTAGPNGNPPYSCHWNPITEWDIVPGQEIGVWYGSSDGNWVGFGFRGPAPNLHVETWSEGGGEAQAGGPAVFGIRYWNDGDIAGRATLTDTLPPGATYVGDSSGFTPVVSGNTVAWDLGAVQPMTRPVQFQLVLRNTANVSDTLRNVADIAAQYDINWGDNHSEAQVHVGAGWSDLYANADASPGDPAPGQSYRWQINYGNYRSIPTGRICITETLPNGTTLVDWKSENGYRLWALVTQANRQVVLCADAIPGSWSDRLFLNVHLDATVPYDTLLLNRVEIGAANDGNLANNVHVNDWTYSRPPRSDTRIRKWWGHGSLAAGAEANYWLEYRNDGNVPLHNLILTDTLPVGTTFITSVLDFGWGIQAPFMPSHVVGRQLIWDLGDLEVNEGQRFMLRLRINHDTPPGTLLSNCAAIAGSDFEDNPYNDAECVYETARAVGPNLRVTNFAWWEGPNRIYYGARIGNIGTTTEYNVAVTDTFPAALNISNWQVNFWEPWWWGQVGNQFTLTLSRVTPGATIWLHLRLDVPAVPYATHFTNTAEITVPPGDVNPSDNRDTIIVDTGSDLSIWQWQSGGPARPRPQEVFTYTLHLENHAQAWGTQGNICITDTLPAKVQFVEMLRRRCWPDFCRENPTVTPGGVLSWCISPWGSNNWDDLYLTVRVRGDVRPGNLLVNTATLYSDDPADIEPDYRDNTSTLTVVTAGETLYLPVIMKR